MKECPNCKELIGDNARTCFNCNYDFSLRKVLDRKQIQQIKASEYDTQQEILRRSKIEQEIKEEQLSKNPRYEYKVETIPDLLSGEPDTYKLQQVLTEYANDGWRLHTALTNETGKNSATTSIINLGLTINATIDTTILIFERCVKA